MTNPYFTYDQPQVRFTLARAQPVNNAFLGIQGAFDLLPTPELLGSGRVSFGIDTGTANAHVVDLDRAPESYFAGLLVEFFSASTNTGTATINVNGLGPAQIRRIDGSPLGANDIVAGMPVTLRHDGTVFRIVNGANQNLASILLARDQAEASAQNSLAQFNSFRSIYYGALSADPATDPLGNAPTEGDWYLNTSLGLVRIFYSGTWSNGPVVDVALTPDVQNNAFNWAGTASGTADDIELSLSPPVQGLVPGLTVTFVGAAFNTGPADLDLDGLGPEPALIAGMPLAPGDIQEGLTYRASWGGSAWHVAPDTPTAVPGIFGLQMSASGSPADVLNVARGAVTAREGMSRVIRLPTGISKDLSATFAPGDGNGGMLDGHVLPTSGQIHVWAITAADGTADVVVTQHSVTGLSGTFTLPSGFVARAYIGTLVAQSGPAIADFHQDGDWIMRQVVGNDVGVTDLGDSDTTYALGPIATGRKWLVDITAATIGNAAGTSGRQISVRDPDATSVGTPSASDVRWTRLTGSDSGPRQTNTFRIVTNDAAQIVARASASASTLYLSVNGWRCPRGEL